MCVCGSVADDLMVNGFTTYTTHTYAHTRTHLLNSILGYIACQSFAINVSFPGPIAPIFIKQNVIHKYKFRTIKRPSVDDYIMEIYIKYVILIKLFVKQLQIGNCFCILTPSEWSNCGLQIVWLLYLFSVVLYRMSVAFFFLSSYFGILYVLWDFHWFNDNNNHIQFT